MQGFWHTKFAGKVDFSLDYFLVEREKFWSNQTGGKEWQETIQKRDLARQFFNCLRGRGR
jgi:hypothetical protein